MAKQKVQVEFSPALSKLFGKWFKLNAVIFIIMAILVLAFIIYSANNVFNPQSRSNQLPIYNQLK